MSSHHLPQITALFSRFRDLIVAVMPNQDAKVFCLKTTFDFFVSNQQMMCIMIEKFLNFQLIEPSCIVSWIFSPYMLPHFDRYATIAKLKKIGHRNIKTDTTLPLKTIMN